MSKLPIANNLSLPDSVITQKLAFLGITGAGKTYAAGKLAELMLNAGAQVVVLDPVGTFWGLRLAADGKGKGIDIPIFGGLKGDIPLEPTAGALFADLIVDRGISAVIDLSQFIPAELYKFAHAFASRLFQRRKAAPAPMHLILEECDDFVPQNLSDKGEEPKMLSAFTRLWKQGRNFGIGGSLLSQRPQEINKKVLNMSSTVFAFNMIGAQERDAVKAWLKSNMSGAERVVETLPSLEIGDAHVFSPRFLKVNQVVHVLPKVTYDASATPDFKSARREASRTLTPIDLDEIKRAMAATIEKAKAEDPKALRAEIAALKRQLKEQESARPVVDQKAIDRAIAETEKAMRAAHFENERKYQRTIADLKERLRNIAALAGGAAPLFNPEPTPKPVELKWNRRKAETPTFEFDKPRPSVTEPPANGNMGKGERAILTALAPYADGRTAVQVAIMTGYAHTGGGFRNYIGALRSRGWIEGQSFRLVITAQGLAALGHVDPLPTGRELVEYWAKNLGKCERAILLELIDAYPEDLKVEDLARRIGYEAQGGGFRNSLGRLRTLELIHGRGEVQASEVFFE